MTWFQNVWAWCFHHGKIFCTDWEMKSHSFVKEVKEMVGHIQLTTKRDSPSYLWDVVKFKSGNTVKVPSKVPGLSIHFSFLVVALSACGSCSHHRIPVSLASQGGRRILSALVSALGPVQVPPCWPLWPGWPRSLRQWRALPPAEELGPLPSSGESISHNASRDSRWRCGGHSPWYQHKRTEQWSLTFPKFP